MERRHFLQGIAVGGIAVVMPAVAQIFAKPITLVVAFAPGGNIDLVARVIAPPLAKELGQPVVIQNKPGAGGAIGGSEVARAEPDGSMLLVTTYNPIVVLPRMAPISYELENFASVGLIAFTSQVVVIRAEKPRFASFGELLRFAKDNPGKVSVGHSGIGTTNHIAILQLQAATGVEFNIIAYKGSGPAILDMLGGQVDLLVDQLSSSIANIKSGRAIALTVLSDDRDPLLPDVPGTREVGIVGLNISTTTGLLAPAKTPGPTINALNAALNKVLGIASVKEQLLNIGSFPMPGKPGVFTTLLETEDRRARALAREGKLKAD